mgnify:FL=1
MNYTSAQANKLLKKLNDEYTALLDKETRSRDFRAAMGEDVESVRPAYDYAETQTRLAALEAKIRKLKHAINIFNATQTVDSFDMTIDELLVYIPQLTKRKSKLLEMKSRLPKERVEEQYGRQSSIIDYTYANYDIAEDRPCDTLELCLCKADGTEENWNYQLNAAEREVLARKMDAFCQEQTGMSLREYTQQLHEEQAQTSEMQM